MQEALAGKEVIVAENGRPRVRISMVGEHEYRMTSASRR
jgi:antitoxin (DNA-binding transcriptional repressor) of toxin-antitoxin stability system